MPKIQADPRPLAAYTLRMDAKERALLLRAIQDARQLWRDTAQWCERRAADVLLVQAEELAKIEARI